MRKAAMAAFRYLPAPLRRAAVHVGAPSYTVGAVAVLRRPDGCLLLVDQRHSDGWALPGGLLRRGEAAADAVVREVREEVGVDLDRATLPVPYAVVTASVRRVDVVFAVDADADLDARQEDDAEVKRLGWYPLDALPPLSRSTEDILRAIHVL
ncbi:MAG: 8-oxo-dGTP diphosphatase [Frankiaceae bacterium]|jgi:ADP-ribose pyrophosphatase YjhB (NUDIX family)|nr:8-oxo-dGTP diphosphatase [Frankiaceae bacterium]